MGNVVKATKWRDNALKNLDKIKVGYDDFKNDITKVYDNMVKKAGIVALKSVTLWQGGLTHSMQDIYKDISDTVKMIEGLIKNAFKAMEDTLMDFILPLKYLHYNIALICAALVSAYI